MTKDRAIRSCKSCPINVNGKCKFLRRQVAPKGVLPSCSLKRPNVKVELHLIREDKSSVVVKLRLAKGVA